MPKIKVAVIGTGHLGSKHLKVFNELKPRVEIAGICDLNEATAMPLANQYGVTYYRDYRELAGKVDAVNICVPTESHFKLAKFFLENNTHTFIEKPITNTIEEAVKLTNIAAKSKLKLQVGHIERFNSAFQSILHFTQKPLFIECHRLNQFPNRSLDIGVVMDLMIHDIDIILGLIRSPIKSIDAIGVNVLTSKEDIASARITFKTGCVCNLTASRVSDDVMRKIRIFQKDTYISLDYVKQEAFIYRKKQQLISKHALPIEKHEPLKKEIEHFIDCIEKDQNPLISGKEAKEALDVALKISRLIWNQLKKK
ncbi:MAG: Gfo/Idh/MocA family oxidoreductase [Candidatus Omnitrophica bacterium]|nr:Gfo/Idh/MocA family oxidoreductase [Candidatus Omnitrophota bacterium]